MALPRKRGDFASSSAAAYTARMLTTIAAIAALLTAPFDPIEEIAVFNINFLDLDGPYKGRLDVLQAEADELASWLHAQSWGQLTLIPTVYDITVNELAGDIGCRQPKRHLPAMMAALPPDLAERVKFRHGVLPASRGFPAGKGCPWKGAAPVGCGAQCRSFSQGDGLARVANHEIGHNMGFPHGASILPINDTHPMKGGTGLHFSAPDSINVGWLTPMKVQGSAFVRIHAMGEPGEANAILRALQWESDAGRFTISRREAVGQDTGPRENPALFGKLSVHRQSRKDDGRLSSQGVLVGLVSPGEWWTADDGTTVAAFHDPHGTFYVGVLR